MATFYKRNFNTGAKEPAIVVTKSDTVDFTKQYSVPGLEGGFTIISSSFSGKMFSSCIINHLFSSKDLTNSAENYKWWPLVIYNSENNERYSYYMINDFSKMGHSSWNNYPTPTNWYEFVNYMNVNHLWAGDNGEKNPPAIGLNRYIPSCFSAQLTGWGSDCWYGGYYTHHYGDNTLLLTEWTEYQSTSALTSSFKTRLIGAGSQLGNVRLNAVNSRPLSYQEVYFDLPEGNTKNITIGFEGILSGTNLDADIAACTGTFYDSLFVLGIKGGWCNQEAPSTTGGYFPSQSMLKNKIYSLRDDNPFSIMKTRVGLNRWYFCDKNMFTLDGSGRKIEHYRGEISNVPEINHSSAHGGDGANYIMARKTSTRTMNTLNSRIHGWYCGPDDERLLEWSAPAEWDASKANLWQDDFQKYFIFGDSNAWNYIDDVYSGADSAQKYKFDGEYVRITNFITTNKQDIIWDMIYEHFSGVPVTALYNGNMIDTYGTNGVFYERCENVQLYREEDINPTRDYTEYKDAFVQQPLYIFKTDENSDRTFGIGTPYNLSAIVTRASDDSSDVYYQGSKTTLELDKWTTDINEATMFLGNSTQDANYIQNFISTINARPYTEWPHSCGYYYINRNNYVIYPTIFTFPNHEANWISMNYFFKQDP